MEGEFPRRRLIRLAPSLVAAAPHFALQCIVSRTGSAAFDASEQNRLLLENKGSE